MQSKSCAAFFSCIRRPGTHILFLKTEQNTNDFYLLRPHNIQNADTHPDADLSQSGQNGLPA